MEILDRLIRIVGMAGMLDCGNGWKVRMCGTLESQVVGIIGQLEWVESWNELKVGMLEWLECWNIGMGGKLKLLES